MTSDSLYQEAIERFRRVWESVATLDLREPAAMFLATADLQGRPSVRTVLLRGFDERGFVFYTNSQSRKGRQLEENSQAALCFYWQALDEQVRVEGPVTKLSEQESDGYWDSRPRESQLGGWASEQSETLDSREQLMRRVAEFETRFRDRPVPRPAHWFGYRVIPRYIEFWKSRPARLHERLCYEQQPDGSWGKRWLYP